MFKNIFFDFDGTLCDTSEGIIDTTLYLLVKHNQPTPGRDEIKHSIGMPLYDLLRKLFTGDDNTIRALMPEWRELYSRRGILNSRLYSGVKGMLIDLKENRRNLIIISKKPEPFVKMLLAKFGIERLFDDLYAISLSQTEFDKVSAINDWIEKKNADRNASVMVGDRKEDIDAGKASGISTIGVAFGYGTEEELHLADEVACDTARLRELLLAA